MTDYDVCDVCGLSPCGCDDMWAEPDEPDTNPERNLRSFDAPTSPEQYARQKGRA